VTGEYKTQRVDEPMLADGQNRISVQIAVMAALRDGLRPREYAVFDRGRWKTFEFEVVPDREVDLAGEKVPAVEVRYSAASSDREWSLFFAPALDYLPVMLVFRDGGKIRSRATLATYCLRDQCDR
jgi:hypothetical protein